MTYTNRKDTAVVVKVIRRYTSAPRNVPRKRHMKVQQRDCNRTAWR